MKILMQQVDAGGGSPTPAPPPPVPVQQQGAPTPPAPTQQQPPQQQQPPDPAKVPGADNKAKPGDQVQIVIKLPDGTKSDPKFVERFTEKAKGLKYSQEQAQGMAEFLASEQAEGVKALDAAFKQQLGKFDETLRADKEFGGSNFDKTTQARDSALKEFGDEETAKFLEDMGATRHPGFSKMMARIRALVSEGTVGDKGGQAAPATDTREAQLRQMFPNSYDQMVGKK